ncbi:4-alpha-glucanotransferase [Marinobacter sp. HL-58]|uniref:4-alpha-glucanotransferase n=1 Tax=Marinobacter sp. HL-58 TaxID=1479237 RepID=UPI000480F1D9|nr:4-alpha-glucanotransferase [Marinobacter sp. HL-58]KPP98882.1 MAG: 4-alpha-glucanotransferase [Marinobacter sp. HL-58]
MSARKSWLQGKRAGVLLHITSLPGTGELGNLGPDAYRFVDFLAAAGFSTWQILPVGPVKDDLSPYNAQSSFAGHIGLLSPQLLQKDGLLPETTEFKGGDETSRQELVEHTWQTFQRDASHRDWARYKQFRQDHAGWLPDYALFRVLRRQHGGQPWYRWPAPLRCRQPAALDAARNDHEDALQQECFGQFLFFDQWSRLSAYAKRYGIELFGDMPIYVAADSADVWCWQDYFTFDDDGRQLAQAGVPPDAFSDTGQLWGNPLYRWDRMASDGYSWWIERFRLQSMLFNILRVDHFRGFESCWEVPADADTAEHGHWVPGPGRALFDAVFDALGPLQLVAEDLGSITREVTALRKDLGFPGMRVLQFAFEGDADNPHRLQHHTPDTVVYTGTHDNDTTLGWWLSLSKAQQATVLDSLDQPIQAMPAPLIHATLDSPARLAIIPMQDLLKLGSEARMNTPGTVKGNWTWRFQWADMPGNLAADYRSLIAECGRLRAD